MTVPPGTIDPNTVAALEARGYDQAPVVDAEGRVVYGLVLTTELRTRLSDRRPLSIQDTADTLEQRRLTIRGGIQLQELLQKVGQEGAILVFQEGDAEEYGVVTLCIGLVTLADLNGHPLRAILYRWLARAESDLARLIRTCCQDPWEWIQKLPEDTQARIVGYWELAKRQGIDVGPHAATTLTELLRIVAGSKELLSELAYTSRNRFEDATGPLGPLRNRVMHPVRPLLHTGDEARRFARHVGGLEDLCDRLERSHHRGARRV